MKKHWTRSGIMNAAGFVLLISAAAVSVVVYLLRYDQLWLWYKVYQEKLLEAEQFIQSLGISWKFVLAMLIVFLVRTFIPFLSVSAICVLTGVVLPSYWALIVNFLGIIIMMSIKYFDGMKFGSGNAWKIISKNERARKIIESSGKVNKALLFALRGRGLRVAQFKHLRRGKRLARCGLAAFFIFGLPGVHQRPPY